MPESELKHKLKMIIFEVEGVLTDGKTWQDSSGSWRRCFSIRDALGIRSLRRAGIRVAVLNHGTSTEVAEHMSRIGIDEYHDDCGDRAECVDRILKRAGFEPGEVGFMTDNVLALPVFKRVGFRFTVPTASQELKAKALLVTSQWGGDGAVLEVCNYILKLSQTDDRREPLRRGRQLAV